MPRRGLLSAHEVPFLRNRDAGGGKDLPFHPLRGLRAGTADLPELRFLQPRGALGLPGNDTRARLRQGKGQFLRLFPPRRFPGRG